jgi:hypothetical protein
MDERGAGLALIEWFVRIAFAYAVVGALFAVPFAWKGAGRIDPAAARAPFGFRLLLLPGACALWPLLLVRWMRGAAPPDERTPHTVAAGRESQP